MSVRDILLVRQAQQGDSDALQQLISRYERKVYLVAFRLLGNRADAADATQEALVKVCVHIRKFCGDARFATWLHRLVINACLDELRKRKKHLRCSVDQAQLAQVNRRSITLLSQEGNPESTLEQQELQQSLHQALAHLREDYRVLVMLRDLEGCSYHEIADITGWTHGAVKSKLHRARVTLRAILQRNPTKPCHRQGPLGQRRHA